MNTLKRMMTNICSNNLERSQHFYTVLFGLEMVFESDWFIHLRSKDEKHELGIISRTNDLVPEAFQHEPNGFYLTFVVDDVEECYQIATSEQIEIVSKPTDTFYGQRRLLVKDPDGALVDISSPIDNFQP